MRKKRRGERRIGSSSSGGPSSELSKATMMMLVTSLAMTCTRLQTRFQRPQGGWICHCVQIPATFSSGNEGENAKDTMEAAKGEVRTDNAQQASKEFTLNRAIAAATGKQILEEQGIPGDKKREPSETKYSIKKHFKE
jgi:hypothetical protein